MAILTTMMSAIMAMTDGMTTITITMTLGDGDCRAGLLDYTVALETLDYLQNETQYVPWQAALIELQELKYILIANQSVYQQFSVGV